MAYWDDIVNNKQLASRTPLQAIRQDVANRVSVYINHTNPVTLEVIPRSPFIAPNIALLESCYSKSNGLSNLKAKIREKQTNILRSECQYCNIGEPNTFDHYLPQADFPEYVALSINLVPCCSRCNYEKGEIWLLGGSRKVINFYYDVLPAVSYLTCVISYTRNIPQATFAINPTVIPVGMRTVIINHFTALKLAERFKYKSNSEITDILNAIAPSAGLLTRVQIQTNLRDEAVRMRVAKGANYWRAALRDALSYSNTFLTSAGY